MPTSNADLTITGKGEVADILRSFASVGLQLQKMQGRLDDLEKGAKQAGTKITTVFDRLAKKIQTSMVSMSDAIERNVKRAAVVFGTGLIATMVKGVKAAADYEKSLATVSTLLGKNAETDIPQYKKSILDLSKTTGESANVLADSLFTIISATVKGSESVDGANKLLAATAKLAVAGFTDTATATTALTTVLNSYNLGAEDAVAVSDKLTKIAALANTTFGAMAPELGKIASVTAAAGISIEELGFMFATLTAGGRKVDMAMTDMRAIINGLTKPSATLIKIYKEAGITSGAAAVKQMGVVKVLELIKEKTGGTFENIQKVIEQQEAWAGSAILLGERLKTAGGVVEQIGNSAGATEDAFKKMSDTFAFKSQQFKAKVSDILIRIGDKILPVLVEKLDKVSAWVDKNSDEIVDFFKKAFDKIVGFGEFIMQHGGAIAGGLAAIWATGKILKFTTSVTSAQTALASLGKFGLIGFALMGAGGIGDFVDAIEAREIAAKKFANDIVTILTKPLWMLRKAEQKFTFGYVEGKEPAAIAEQAAAKALMSKEEEEERKKWRKQREADLKALHQIQIAGMDEINKAYAAWADRRAAVEGMTTATAEEKQKALAEIDRQWLKQKDAIEKKIEKKKADAQSEYIKKENKAAQARRNLFEKANEVAQKAADDYHQMRVAAEEEAIAIQERGAQYLLEKAKERTEAIMSVVSGVLQTIGSEIDSIFGQIYRKAYDQFKELFNLAISAAAEGVKQLVLTSADRAQMEREMGRALTPDEARARATAYTGSQLSELERQGRIGAYEVVGQETPQDRMTTVLEQMLEWWNNLAANLDGILTWVTETAAPALIKGIVENIPAIVKALNDSWREGLPQLIDMIADYLGNVLEEIPGIIEALIQGIIAAIIRLIERLPDILKGIFSMLSHLIPTLIDVILDLIIKGIPKIVMEIIKAIPQIVVELVKSIFTELLPGIVTALIDALKDLFGGSGKITGSKAGDTAVAIATGGVSKVGEWLGLWHEGGMIYNALKAHQGMFMSPQLAADEVPIIAQTGEAVLSRRGVAAVGGEQGVDGINSGLGAGGGSSTVNVRIDHMMSGDTGVVVDKLISNLARLGVSRVANRGGGTPGYRPRRR